MKSNSILILLISAFLLVGCATQKNKKDIAKEGLELQKPISVGTILTKLEIVDATESELPERHLKAKVIEVLGYGANTDMIGKEAILTFKYADSEALSMLDTIKTGETIEAVISPPKKVLSGTTQDSVWTIIEINK